MGDLVEREGVHYKKFTDVPFTGEVAEGLIKGLFKNGKREGFWQFYWDNGQLWKKGNYTSGNQVGFWEHYHANGKLWQKGHYKTGMKDGVWVYLKIDGSIWKLGTGTYKNGVKVSD